MLLIVAIPIGILFSSIIFQGHIHPDNWGFIWQEIPILAAIVVVYLFYLFKVLSKREGKFENS